MNKPHVVVVGGGITGLSAAYLLDRSGVAEVTLLEATNRVGGKILTTEFAGLDFDMGADAMLDRGGWVRTLCAQLGLGDRLTSPSTRRALVHSRGQLRPLPLGAVLGVASGVSGLIRSGVLGPFGASRAVIGSLVPRRRTIEDAPVGAVVSHMLGESYRRAIVDPLLGGVYAGDTATMSYQATLPQWDDLLRDEGRLRFRPAPLGSGSPFVSFTRGLGVLPETLAQKLGQRIHLNQAATQVDGSGTVKVTTGAGTLEADAVILAAPATRTAGLIESAHPAAAELLREIRHASVVVVAMTMGSEVVLPEASGFLIPPASKMVMTACTFSSRKWGHLAEGGRVMVRCSAGRIGDDRASNMSDNELIDVMCAELTGVTGVAVHPLDVVVRRWPQSLPEYRVGHLVRVRTVRSILNEHGLFPGGAAFDGVGIAACIRQAHETADRVRAYLSR